MKLSKLKINPDNPQKFTRDELEPLKRSLEEFPKMLELRPLVYDPKTMYVLGGNKRLICLQELGKKEIPDSWALAADKLTEAEKQRFIIADNVGFGEWDEFTLKKNYDLDDLKDWGLNIEKEAKEFEIKKETLQPYSKNHVLISFEPDKNNEIMDILSKLPEYCEIVKSAN